MTKLLTSFVVWYIRSCNVYQNKLHHNIYDNIWTTNIHLSLDTCYVIYWKLIFINFFMFLSNKNTQRFLYCYIFFYCSIQSCFYAIMENKLRCFGNRVFFPRLYRRSDAFIRPCDKAMLLLCYKVTFKNVRFKRKVIAL